MNYAVSDWDDTIVALATPPGVGAISIIRVSGREAYEIVDKLFPSKNLLKQDPNTLHIGYLKKEEKILDEVVLSLFRSPRSYTGEDIIEISCHGSLFIQQEIINACVDLGARLAKPGEFTQRAFLRGKLDLAQAEAVADIIASNSEASHRVALDTMRGGFSSKLRDLRTQLIRFSALIELELDFSQEDVEFADRNALHSLIGDLENEVGQLMESFRLGNVIKNGVSVAIIGKPNAGKSTLLNVLLNESRAIVSDIPGTTRDTIEEVVNIGGILFRLIDTAGIRSHTSDIIEKAGVERSLEKMKQAQLIIYLFDAIENESEIESLNAELESQGLNYLLVANKADELKGGQQKFVGISDLIFISAKEGLNIELLKGRMVDSFLKGKMPGEGTIVTNARHFQALKEVDKSLKDIRMGLDNKLPGDLLALDIRRCLHYLGEITGQVSNEDLLDFIFSKFCIGK